jgi:hypothetical protein
MYGTTPFVLAQLQSSLYPFLVANRVSTYYSLTTPLIKCVSTRLINCASALHGYQLSHTAPQSCFLYKYGAVETKHCQMKYRGVQLKDQRGLRFAFKLDYLVVYCGEGSVSRES